MKYEITNASNSLIKIENNKLLNELKSLDFTVEVKEEKCCDWVEYSYFVNIEIAELGRLVTNLVDLYGSIIVDKNNITIYDDYVE